MKNVKFFLIIPAAAIVTLLSIFFSTSSQSYASKSIMNTHKYTNSEKTKGNCCEKGTGCGDMAGDGLDVKRDHSECADH